MLDFGKKESPRQASVSDCDAEVLVDNGRNSADSDTELVQVGNKGMVSGLQLAEKFRN